MHEIEMEDKNCDPLDVVIALPVFIKSYEKRLKFNLAILMKTMQTANHLIQ